MMPAGYYIPCTDCDDGWVDTGIGMFPCPVCDGRTLVPSAAPAKQRKQAGWIFEGRFYKSLDDLSGTTFNENNHPVPVFYE